MDLNSKPLVLPQLDAYRKATAKRRATAFCDAPEYVFGIEVKPLTPATWSMLCATGSRFVKGETALEGDVRNYLWFHSPRYGLKASKRVKRRALGRLTMAATQPWARWLGLKPSITRYCSVLATAVAEIETLIFEAFADAPQAKSNKGKPLATLESQLIVEFARELYWAPEQTRHTPLKQLFQHLRCIHASKGHEPEDAGEDAMLYAHMKARNDALLAAREKEAANA